MVKNKIITKGMGGHQQRINKTYEWLTPPQIINSLGEFDLDPCSPVVRPWDTAKKHYTKEDNGLIQPWEGRVWLNPPYGNDLLPWLKKMMIHNNGIALTFARTETVAFRDYVWPAACSMLFIYNRLTFYRATATGAVPADHNGGAPSVLIAYGEQNTGALEQCGIPGKHVYVNSVPIIVVGVSPSWKAVITIAITRLNGQAEVKAIYEMVELIAPDKTKNNSHYKEKIRQKLQTYFVRVQRGIYSND